MITEGQNQRAIHDVDAGPLILEHLTQDGQQPAVLEYIRVSTLTGQIQLKVANGMKVVIDTRLGAAPFHITRC